MNQIHIVCAEHEFVDIVVTSNGGYYKKFTQCRLCGHLFNSTPTPESSVATDDASSNADGNINPSS